MYRCATWVCYCLWGGLTGVNTQIPGTHLTHRWVIPHSSHSMDWYTLTLCTLCSVITIEDIPKRFLLRNNFNAHSGPSECPCTQTQIEAPDRQNVQPERAVWRILNQLNGNKLYEYYKEGLFCPVTKFVSLERRLFLVHFAFSRWTTSL